MRKRIPTPISGGLVLSYQCSAACLHCMYACSPQWEADWISEGDLESILGQLAGRIHPSPGGPEMICLNHGLHFTGGEPFVKLDLLCRAVEIAAELGIPSLFVETNGFWCVHDRSTRERLRLLKDRGLAGMLVSVNPFYLEYVPFERTERAVRIGYEVFGHNLAVYQAEYYSRFRRLGIRGRVSFEEYLRLEGRDDFARNTEFFLMGRAAYKVPQRLPSLFPAFPARQLLAGSCVPSFLRSWHNHFDCYGHFVPGYCGGISLGDCRRLDELLEEGIDPEEFPVLAFLMDEDLGGLFHFARERGYTEEPRGYVSRCHLCTDLRRFLCEQDGFAELRPREFYRQLE